MSGRTVSTTAGRARWRAAEGFKRGVYLGRLLDAEDGYKLGVRLGALHHLGEFVKVHDVHDAAELRRESIRLGRASTY